jgi:hypothetical protein
VIHDLHHRLDRPCFWVICTKYQASNARMNQSSRAHRAWLNCSKEVTVSQTVVTNDGTRFAQRDDLRMCRWIIFAQILVPAPCDDRTVADYDRTHRNLSRFQAALSRTEGFLHEEFVGIIVGRES